MNMDPRLSVGGNNPPDPIDEINARFESVRMEAENWTDGEPVENEAQMKALDVIRAGLRDWRLSLERGQKDATAPLYDAYKAEGARWKPEIDDAKRIEGCVVAALDGFKRKLAAEKETARRKAEAEAWEAGRAAREAVEAAKSADLEAQRQAAAAVREAEEAQARAAAAKEDAVKGLRAVTEYVVIDGTGFARWLWQNDRAALSAWMDEYARRNKIVLPGIVEARTERRAF